MKDKRRGSSKSKKVTRFRCETKVYLFIFFLKTVTDCWNNFFLYFSNVYNSASIRARFTFQMLILRQNLSKVLHIMCTSSSFGKFKFSSCAKIHFFFGSRSDFRSDCGEKNEMNLV